MNHTAIYAGFGPEVCHYALDLGDLSLHRKEGLTLPGNVQYIWRHASLPLLYVASSNRLTRHDGGNEHHLTALRIDEQSGNLSLFGEPARLSHRPVHLCMDRHSEHALLAFDTPSEVQVYRIAADGSVGQRVGQRDGIDWGVFGHQVRVAADDRLAFFITRGMPSRGGNARLDPQVEPGALKVFRYEAGRLGDEASIAPGDGRHFAARYLDYHPTRPWLYLALEQQNKVCMFRREGDRVQPEPAFVKDTLPDPERIHTEQVAGALEVHPNGRFLYCVNRDHTPTPYQGRKVLSDLVNSIAVYAIDQTTGEPTMIQHIDSGGIFPRTFHIHPNGRLLAICNGEPHPVRAGDEIRDVAANIALFEIGEDGRLRLLRKHDFPAGPKGKLWMYMTCW